MKRFMKTFAFLIVSLFLVVSGVDAALDHLSHSRTQNAITEYDEQGIAVLAYEGDLNGCKVCFKPGLITPNFLHRT